jgi:hypothetical protein
MFCCCKKRFWIISCKIRLKDDNLVKKRKILEIVNNYVVEKNKEQRIKNTDQRTKNKKINDGQEDQKKKRNTNSENRNKIIH